MILRSCRKFPTRSRLVRIFALLFAVFAAECVISLMMQQPDADNGNIVHIAYAVSNHTESFLFYVSIKSLMLSHHNSTIAINAIIFVPNAELGATIAEILDSWLLIGFTYQIQIEDDTSLAISQIIRKWHPGRAFIAQGFPIFPMSTGLFIDFVDNQAHWPWWLSWMDSNGLYLVTSSAWTVFVSGPLYPNGDMSFPKTALDVISMAPDLLAVNGYILGRKRRYFKNATNSPYPTSHDHIELLDNLKLIEKSSICDDYRSQASVIRRKIPFFLSDRPRSLEGDQNAIAIISIATLDHIGNIESQCKYWHSGPMSVSVNLHDSELASLIEMLTPSHPKSLHCLANSKHVHVHVAFWASSMQPLAYLWNVALEHIPDTVEYVFMLDSDIWPSHSLAATVLGKHRDLLESSEKLAFVMPAFEADPKVISPHQLETLDKSTVRELYATSQIAWFYRKRFDPGHEPTDFPRWMNTSEPYEVDYKWMFEPFVIVKYDKARGMPPRCEERFIGYALGRQSYTMNLVALGYHFVVEPDAFMMHVNHPQSPDSASARSDFSAPYWQCIHTLANNFTRLLIKKYGDHLNGLFQVLLGTL